MTFNGWIQIALYCAIVILLVKPFGGYMTRVFTGERTFLSPGAAARSSAASTGCAASTRSRSRTGSTYAVAMLLFSLVGLPRALRAAAPAGGAAVQPAGQSAVEQSLAFNTAVSFVTNTNWQSYVPETTMSYLVQMAGLTVHNFVSAATGIALAIALVRGFARRSARGIGNFWVDLIRCTLYVLLPISIVVGLFFVWQGMPQNLGAYTEATTLEGAKQVIAQGPVASQEVIKMLGTNGGGFFNANSAHPFENPNALTNFVQIVLIFSIGAALTNVFGRMVGDQRQGWAMFAVMGILFLVGVVVAYGPRPPATRLCRAARRPAASALQAGGNMEGKEVRFGIANSALFATITTDASCGAVNAMHDSFIAARRRWCRWSTSARRDHLRRRRLRALRHAAVRHRRGVHRRADGRPHAGISRQEDRGERGQDGNARHLILPLLRPREPSTTTPSASRSSARTRATGSSSDAAPGPSWW